MTAQRIAQLSAAIARQPQDPELHYDLGGLLLASGQAAEALSSYQAAIRLAPGHPQVLLQLGNALSALGRYSEATHAFQQALRADPALMAAHYNLGNALRELGQPEAAATAYRAALKLNPRDADSHNNLGNVLRELGQLDRAIACYQEALRLKPDLHHARMHLLHQRQHVGDWGGLDAEIAQIRRIVREEPGAQISPFAFLALPGTTAAEQRQCAEQWVSNRYGPLLAQAKPAVARPPRPQQDRLRIGYLSADFRQHPLAWLATEVMELHARDRFEIHGYSYGRNDGTPERQRWERAFQHFHEIRDVSVSEAAQRIRADGIDLLVDLTGFTHSSRSGILALRPAPIQASWLGFPGTMGAPFVDYLISDGFITPPALKDNYREQLALLPNCYQPNDRQRPSARPPSRAACGLPEHAFVFCCFNQTFKITPQLYDYWMNILKAIPDSVLWLLECNPWAKTNLQREATLRGVNPTRLIFAPRVPIAEHLARHACADLMLDTLPYNAHTTTSDALWMGLPMVTCVGDTFASRVAGSLLHACGLPQLVTTTLPEYQALAVRLASDKTALAEVRALLACAPSQSALFDTPRFVRQLEQAYQVMAQRHAAGRAPSLITPADLC